ncbi:MAG TPA: hypothetical protein VHO25_14195 [Polyangiaceae bacterium]|nr:hypothetical protein [Polyangiaceae bacterium]
MAKPTIGRLAAALLISVNCLVACSRGSAIDPNLQREAGALLQGVDRLRQAANADKPLQLASLAALPCSHASTCGLKDRCVDAYQGFVKALGDIARIEGALVNSTTLSPADLAGAQHALDTAREKTLACASEQGELARRMTR